MRNSTIPHLLVYLACGWSMAGCDDQPPPRTFVFAPGATTGGASGGGGTDGGGTVEMAPPRPDAGGEGPGTLSEPWPSAGCGKPFDVQSRVVQKRIATTGVKDPNCTAKLSSGVSRCGPWSLEREYVLYLPANYDPNQPYPLVFEAPGCTGTGKSVYDLPNVTDDVIRVGLTPPPSSIGHATNPDQSCFDDREGDDSVDFVFYETLYDELNETLCFDRNLVHAVGDASGGLLERAGLQVRG